MTTIVHWPNINEYICDYFTSNCKTYNQFINKDCKETLKSNKIKNGKWNKRKS